MQKDFDNWNKQKKGTDARHARAPFRDLGTNVGDEQDGKGKFFSRPILVIKKLNKHIFLGMPLGTILKEDNRFYHRIHFKGRDQSVVLSQLRLLDAKRLENRMGDLPSHEFERVKDKLKELIF